MKYTPPKRISSSIVKIDWICDGCKKPHFIFYKDVSSYYANIHKESYEMSFEGMRIKEETCHSMTVYGYHLHWCTWTSKVQSKLTEIDSSNFDEIMVDLL